jgi:hypothetical protein
MTSPAVDLTHAAHRHDRFSPAQPAASDVEVM